MIFSAYDGRRRWIHLLKEVVKAYNNTVHNSIEMAPNDVTRKNARLLFDMMEAKRNLKIRKRKNKYNFGDIVRIPIDADLKQKLAKKGYAPNWSKELFQIIHIDFGTYVPIYTLADLTGKKLRDRFYENQLNLVSALSEF